MHHTWHLHLWKPHANLFRFIVNIDGLFLNRDIHRSSSHLVQALCASAEPLELSVHYPEPPSSEPGTGDTDIDVTY